ncbi:MAG: LacI family DNA-binding transcriptional regulator [Rhodobacteraceae bacterium]|jgi:DNA-binding LacI/PurR family transcriptional regulator|nr:LacI family DNA-binding transcriptional regulator [Paracoccaceae bacterium]
MPVTLKEVAELAGVSRSAVSRTFTPGASVSDRTRAKVEQAARALGYAPSALASALSTGRTRLIGLVANNFHNPLFLDVFDRFTRLLQDRGLRPLLVNLTEETDPGRSVRLLRQYSVDAVIVASSTLPDGFARAFRDAGLPVVHAFGRRSTAPEVHVVGIDNMDCGRLAARTFRARGYRDVAFLGGPEHATSTRDRLAGFAEEIARLQGMRHTASFAAAYTFEAGRTRMQALLAAAPPAEAYFCGDDVVAVGALSALRDAGVQVPGQVGLLGLNDMQMAGWANIDLTTIRQPIPDIIAASVDLAVASIDDPARPPEARLFPCVIVERKTLRPPQDGLPDPGA